MRKYPNRPLLSADWRVMLQSAFLSRVARLRAGGCCRELLIPASGVVDVAALEKLLLRILLL